MDVKVKNDAEQRGMDKVYIAEVMLFDYAEFPNSDEREAWVENKIEEMKKLIPKPKAVESKKQVAKPKTVAKPAKGKGK